MIRSAFSLSSTGKYLLMFLYFFQRENYIKIFLARSSRLLPIHRLFVLAN